MGKITPKIDDQKKQLRKKVNASGHRNVLYSFPAFSHPPELLDDLPSMLHFVLLLLALVVALPLHEIPRPHCTHHVRRLPFKMGSISASSFLLTIICNGAV